MMLKVFDLLRRNKEVFYMTLYEYLYSGFGKAEDLNCAEKMLYGANKVYELGINRNDLKLAAGFGGGVCYEGQN